MHRGDAPILVDIGEGQLQTLPTLIEWTFRIGPMDGIAMFIRCRPKLHGPTRRTFLNMAPPKGTRPTVGTLALGRIPLMFLACIRKLRAIVRIYCYHLLMSSVLAHQVTPSGTGPLTAAPPYFAFLLADEGRPSARGECTARNCPRMSAWSWRTLDAGLRTATSRTQFGGAAPRLGKSLQAAQVTATASLFEGLVLGLGRGPMHRALAELATVAFMKRVARTLKESHRSGFMNSMPRGVHNARGLARLPPPKALLTAQSREPRPLLLSRGAERETRTLDKAARPQRCSSPGFELDDVKGQMKSQKCTSCMEFEMPRLATTFPRTGKRIGKHTSLPAEECWGAPIIPLGAAWGLPRPSPPPPPRRPNMRPGIELCSASSCELQPRVGCV